MTNANKNGSLKCMRSRAFLIVCSLCLFIASGADARVKVPPPSSDCMRPDLELLFKPLANCAGAIRSSDGGSVPYRFNSEGLADREYAREKKAYRILVLGDSNIVSQAASPDAVRLMERQLSRILKGKRVEAINAGTNGYSLPQIYLRLPRLLERYRPDTVLVVTNIVSNSFSTYFHHAVADKNGLGLASSFASFRYFWPLPKMAEERIWRSPYKFTALKYSLAAQQFFFVLKRKIMPDAGPLPLYSRYLKELGRVSQAGGANFLVAQIAESVPEKIASKIEYKAEYVTFRLWKKWLSSDSIRKMYSELNTGGIPVLRLVDNFAQPIRGDFGKFHLADGGHLNPAGMAILGETLARTLAPEIQKLSVKAKAKSR